MRTPVECKNCGLKWLNVNPMSPPLEAIQDIQLVCPRCGSNYFTIILEPELKQDKEVVPIFTNGQYEVLAKKYHLLDFSFRDDYPEELEVLFMAIREADQLWHEAEKREWKRKEADWLEKCCSYNLFTPTMPQIAQAFIEHIKQLRKEAGE